MLPLFRWLALKMHLRAKSRGQNLWINNKVKRQVNSLCACNFCISFSCDCNGDIYNLYILIDLRLP